MRLEDELDWSVSEADAACIEGVTDRDLLGWLVDAFPDVATDGISAIALHRRYNRSVLSYFLNGRLPKKGTEFTYVAGRKITVAKDSVTFHVGQGKCRRRWIWILRQGLLTGAFMEATLRALPPRHIVTFARDDEAADSGRRLLYLEGAYGAVDWSQVPFWSDDDGQRWHGQVRGRDRRGAAGQDGRRSA